MTHFKEEHFLLERYLYILIEYAQCAAHRNRQ